MSRRLLPGLAALACALAAPSAAQAATPQFYLSLGDSYAAGAQVVGGSTRSTLKGFANQLPALAAKRGYALELVNYGCGGATTTSMVRSKGCPDRLLARGGTAYPGRTQATAAVDFLKRNRARTGLVTVSIGGNDVTACARAADPVPCVAAAAEGINTNLKALLTRLRAAGGPKVRIVGITYPDVILGEWLKGTPEAQQFAGLSQVAFKSIINPALKTQYEAVKGTFVDVTAATGGYGSLDDRTSVPALSPTPIPVAVARVCALTYYCSDGDIHSRTAGYAVIADLVAKTLPRRR